MNDENDKKDQELTVLPLTEEQNVTKAESAHITKPLIDNETEQTPSQAAVCVEETKALTEEEEEKLKKEEEKKQKEEEKRKEEEAKVKEFKAAIEEQAREDEQPQSSNFSLRKILGGDILSARLIRNNIWLIIIIVIFIIIYISNRYSVQKYLIEIDKLKIELKDAKYRALSSSSQLTEKTRESHILEILNNRRDSTLKMSDRPPYIINIPEK